MTIPTKFKQNKLKKIINLQWAYSLYSRFRFQISNSRYTRVIKKITKFLDVNRYRRKRPKVDASIFDSALSNTRRSDASEKKTKILASTFERFRLWTSLESSPLSVKAIRVPYFERFSVYEITKLATVM